MRERSAKRGMRQPVVAKFRVRTDILRVIYGREASATRPIPQQATLTKSLLLTAAQVADTHRCRRLYCHTDRYGVYFAPLAQRILESLYRSATFTGRKTKHDLGQIDHMTVSNCGSRLALWQLQLDNSIHLVQPVLNPFRLLKTRVGNNSPTDFTILQ